MRIGNYNSQDTSQRKSEVALENYFNLKVR